MPPMRTGAPPCTAPGLPKSTYTSQPPPSCVPESNSRKPASSTIAPSTSSPTRASRERRFTSGLHRSLRLAAHELAHDGIARATEVVGRPEQPHGALVQHRD